MDEAYRNHPEIQFMMVNVTDGSQETMESARISWRRPGMNSLFFTIRSWTPP